MNFGGPATSEKNTGFEVVTDTIEETLSPAMFAVNDVVSAAVSPSVKAESTQLGCTNSGALSVTKDIVSDSAVTDARNTVTVNWDKVSGLGTEQCDTKRIFQRFQSNFNGSKPSALLSVLLLFLGATAQNTPSFRPSATPTGVPALQCSPGSYATGSQCLPCPQGDTLHVTTLSSAITGTYAPGYGYTECLPPPSGSARYLRRLKADNSCA